MKRDDLLGRIKSWNYDSGALAAIRKKLERMNKAKFHLESKDGLFWSELKDLAQEVAQEHAEALSAERGWECSPQDVLVNAVTDVTEKSITIIYALHVAHRVVIRYFLATNATILENFEEDAC